MPSYRWGRLILWVLFAAMLSCAPRSLPYLVLPGSPPVDVGDLSTRYPLVAGQAIRAESLGATRQVSYHFVQIRAGEGERPHLHARHDLLVVILSGKGSQWIDGRVVPLRRGDTALVAAGKPHHFVNTGESPAAALVVFSPPYDGSDQVPLGD